MRVTHLNGLRALEATLRGGSFRAAADELGVTTAAIGHQIRGLEHFLGREPVRQKVDEALAQKDFRWAMELSAWLIGILRRRSELYNRHLQRGHGRLRSHAQRRQL